MKIRRLFLKLVPRSLLSRMLWLLLLAIVLAQSLISGLWMQQLQKHELDGMMSATRNLANSAASTITFFQSLPLQYRQIALDQLRNMGGSRFFVSLNKAEIQLDALPDSNRKNLVINEVRNVLHHKLGYGLEIQADFAAPDTLHVFNNQTALTDLPLSWAQHTLLIDILATGLCGIEGGRALCAGGQGGKTVHGGVPRRGHLSVWRPSAGKLEALIRATDRRPEPHLDTDQRQCPTGWTPARKPGMLLKAKEICPCSIIC